MTKKRLLLGVSFVLLATIVGMVLYLGVIFAGNYVIDDQKLVMPTSTSIVDEEGELLTKLYIENRELVSLDDVPKHVREAFVAIEDARFYEHQGIDVWAIGRALFRDIVANAKVEGGSTITQQLVKNTFLSHEKTWLRKTKEVLIAMNLERKYSKNELLEMYLNRIYFGHGAYGIQAAAKLYFNKNVSELSIEEGALLAGLPKAPNSFSPLTNIERSKQRRDLVLTVMQRRGYLTAEQAVRLRGKKVAVEEIRATKNDAYLTYIDMVLDEAEEKYHITNEELLTGGYTIVVPIDRKVQEKVYDLFQDKRYFPGKNAHAEGAFVLIDNDSGGIIAAQGGRNYVSKGINRVNVKRQPGSTIKPLAVYGPAIEEGMYEPYSMLKDERIDYNGYSPRNYDNRYEQEVTLYDALVRSANAPAVWLLNELGITSAKNYLEKLEIPIRDEGLAIALGGLEEGLSPLEMAKAYRPFAQEGKLIEPYVIKELYDQSGKLIGKAETEEKEVFSPQTAWYMTRMLEAVVKDGTGQEGHTLQALAGKTGTTSFTEVSGATRDAWFVGYTPHVVGALWIGYDMTTSENYLTGGSSYPTILFKDIIDEFAHDKPLAAFTPPEGVLDLEPPIRFSPIRDLTASLTLKGKGLVGVELSWEIDSLDERLHYNVYEVTDGTAKKIGTVSGKGQFIVDHVNPFSLKEYFVVPFNQLSEREGPASNVVAVSTWWNFLKKSERSLSFFP